MNYEVDVSAEEGSRIKNLHWPDGTEVADDDVLTLAANNYRANSNLLAPGDVFEEGDLPKLLEIDVASSLGGIRELIGEYIENVCGGIITPEVDDNWRIVGPDWDPKLHQQAIEVIAQGTLSVATGSDRDLPEAIVTENDLTDVGGA